MFYSIISDIFLGCRLIAVGPRRSNGRPRAKGHYSVSIIFQKPKWISRQKILSRASNKHSSNNAPLDYISLLSEHRFEGLPKIAASFNPHEFNLGKLVKRFRKRRAVKRSHEKQSNTLLPEAVIKEKFYKDSINKE
jgi:hypothetical protein